MNVMGNTFPEFSPRCDAQSMGILHVVGYLPVLARHFGSRKTTLVYGEVPICGGGGFRQGIRLPNLIIAFDCDPERVIARRGYDVAEQGKPPNFAFEIASKTTGRVDWTEKRIDYERYGVGEYWRFDVTSDDWRDAGLTADRLVDGRYAPIAIERKGVGYCRGYSEALGLYVCWDAGKLRWHDPAVGNYLRTFDDEADRADRLGARARQGMVGKAL